MTSLTTAGAFLACVSSPVTSIRCFGLYCALVVLCDWLLMVTGVPALMVLYRRYVVHRCSRACGGLRLACNTPMHPDSAQMNRRPPSELFMRLAPIITDRRFGMCAISLCVAFAAILGRNAFYPGLQYPLSGDIIILRPDHPLELYCCTGVRAASRFGSRPFFHGGAPAAPGA